MSLKFMNLESIFTFGDEVGKQLEDVIIDNPDYIGWLVENDVVTFDEKALELIRKKGIA